MRLDDFEAFYRKVHENDPFPWQSRLVRGVQADRRWPEIIALPTSAGKTSLIDIAVFLLALEANVAPPERLAALRIFFVIDRRAVVDEAFEHARTLADALRNAHRGILHEAAGALRGAFGTCAPLRVVALRGGTYLDQTWADEPNQPLVCVSTVDQVGSRLLFRGYQISEAQRPVHAGLIGVDSLIIVDEAHLSTAFCDTLRAVRHYSATPNRSIGRRMQFIRMSATPGGQEDFFGPDDKDYANEKLRARWNASKRVELREPGDLEKEAAKAAIQLSEKPGVDVVAIVVNRVSSARSIFDELPQSESVLLTGRIRPYDRDRLMARYIDRLKSRTHRTHGEKLYVVTTQTIEVGANFDFDAMISEAAPLDALRQRFGRLDRFGSQKNTEGIILLRKQSQADPIYGNELSTTWKWLWHCATLENHSRIVDFGVEPMEQTLRVHPAEGLDTKRNRGPILSPAHLETWVQTNPTPEPDPDVAPFLHGADALDAADVQIVWRADFPENSPDKWIEIACLSPPNSREALPVPIGAARRWLNGSTAQPVTDLEGIVASDTGKVERKWPFLTWKGPDRTQLNQLYPGVTIMVPAVYGGCDRFGWNPGGRGTVPDIADLCALEAAELGLCRGRARVHADVLGVSKEEFRSQMTALKEFQNTGDEEAEEAARTELLDWIKTQDLLPEVTAFLSVLETKDYDDYPSGEGFVVTARRRKRRAPRTSASPEETDDDDAASWTDRSTLREHSEAVAARGRYYAERAGAGARIAADIYLALLMHDLGKCDERFQAMLHGGSRERALAASEPLAKSPARGQTSARLRQWRHMSGYPDGARHEFVSAVLATQSAVLDEANDRELGLHLISTHHGSGRPFAPYWRDDENPVVRCQWKGHELSTRAAPSLHRFESGWTDQFWRLVDRYGCWGLAWLEAIVRRADCVQSREDAEA